MRNSSIHPKNLMKKYNANPSLFLLKESLSINYNNQNQKEELNNILRLIKLETDTNTTRFDT